MMSEDRNDRPRLVNVNDESDTRTQEIFRLNDIDPLEVQVGRHFAREYEGRFLFNHHMARWMHWTGMRWKVDEVQFTMDAMMTFADRIRLLDVNGRKALGTVKFIKNALQVAACSDEMRCTSADFDSDPLLVGTPTGYIDLRTGEHHRPDPSKLISICTGVAPTDEAVCPKWRAHLEWATKGDRDLVRYLQKYFGYCLSGLMNEEIMTFIYGPGGNGKGVMLSVLGKVMGEYYISTPASTFMDSKHKEHSTELARLQYRRLVSASETSDSDKWNIARIKDITGNEAPITARFMRQDFFDFRPVCKLLIIGNSKPAFDDVNEAIVRRLRMIRFMQTPAEVDNTLKEQFNGEFAGILRWMVDGFRMYQEEGLKIPDTVRSASNDYLREQDIAKDFVSTCLEFRERGRLLRSDVALAIGVFLKHNGHSKGLKATKVYKALEEDYHLSKDEFHQGTRAFHGVNIKPEFWKVIQTRMKDEFQSPNDEMRGHWGE